MTDFCVTCQGYTLRIDDYCQYYGMKWGEYAKILNNQRSM